MKKLIWLLVTALLWGGSSIAPVNQSSYTEPTIYLGVGFNTDWEQDAFDSYTNNGMTVIAGANVYNSYSTSIAIEGRYSTAFENYAAESASLYARPEYAIGDKVGIYGLLGASYSTIFDYDLGSVDVGGGIAAYLDNGFCVMVDYVWRNIEKVEEWDVVYTPQYGQGTISLLYKF